MIGLSTVTPVYRGEAVLTELVERLEAVRVDLERGGGPLRLIESIFVDDGSVDGSARVLDELAHERPWMRVVTLSRNYGQHAATMAGIVHSSGDWVATLDEDLQHRPEHLLALLRAAVGAAIDVVYAEPEDPVHESWFRDLGSRGFKWLVSRLSGNEDVKLFNSFRMIRGSVARGASAVAAHDTYFDLAVTWFTSSIGSVPLPLRDRRYAEQRQSGYRLRSLLSHARRMLQSSNVKVVRLGAGLGFFAMLVAVLSILYTVTVKLIFPEMAAVSGWASVMVGVLFMGGLNALLAGLVLEHMSMLLMQSHGRPTFFVVDRSRDRELVEWFESRPPARS